MGQQLQMPALVTREVKGSALSMEDMDKNLNIIRNFCNSVASFFGVALNTDGSLQDGTVSEGNLVDRSVSANKIELNFLPVRNDVGTVNSILVQNELPITAYTNGLVFFIHVANLNTSSVTIAADSLDPVPLLKNGGQAIAAGDLLKNQLICAAYKDGNFYLLQPQQSATSSGSSGSGSGLIKYGPNSVALPGNGLSVSFVHALATTPDKADVVLVNVVPEYGYVAGDEVPIRQFVDGVKAPAFAVDVNATSINITQLTASVSVARIDVGNVGTLAAITPASWQVKVRAEKTTESSPLIFPALDVMSYSPDGGVGYGTYLFYFNHASTSGKTFLNRLDMSTGNVKCISAQNLGTAENINPAIFRSATTGKDIMVYSCSLGIFWVPLQDPTPDGWAPQEYGAMGSNWQNFKPVQIVESGSGNSQLAPTIYAVACNLGTALISSLTMQKIVSSTNSGSAVAPTLNLTNAASGSIVNISEFKQWHNGDAKVLHFQFNPIKKRIYLITAETCLIHIFTINNSDFAAWWTGPNREANMTYVKALALCGGGAGWGQSQHCRFNIEFDLTSGQEKSVVYTRDYNIAGATSFPGSVTRVPWNEN